MIPLLSIVALPGCGMDAPAPPCTEGWITAFVDADGDGWGQADAGLVCGLSQGLSELGQDCDDDDPTIHPELDEECDGIDNNCDGQIDEDLPRLKVWYFDGDRDGYGVLYPAMRVCGDPGDDWVSQLGDCDDDDPQINPDGTEICNDHIDDDCDGLEDGLDPSLDTSTLLTFYRDRDADGYGQSSQTLRACHPQSGYVDNASDCNDSRADVNPDAVEVCSGYDNDCDDLIDDADPSIDPSSQSEFFLDADLDGYGAPGIIALACVPGNGAVDNEDDCDDSNPAVHEAVDWYFDGDGDGYGVGASVGFACFAPFNGAAPTDGDCDDFDPNAYPGAPEICEDFIDQSCTGSDTRCAKWFYTIREGDNWLRRIDMITLTWEDIGPIGVAFDFGDLAWDEKNATMYLIDGRGAQALHTVDLLTGNATTIGNHNISDLFGLAWDSSTDTLYGSGESPSGLYEMNLNTGAGSWIGDPGLGLDGLTYDSTLDRLVGFWAGPGDVYEIDETNGNPTYLGGSGFINNGGMGYDPDDNLFYTIDWSGVLYSFDPLNGYVRTTVLSGLGAHDGFVHVPNPPN